MIFIFYILFNILAHPIHTSVTNISYNQDKKAFEISARLFKHDLQSAIYKKWTYTINIKNEKTSDSTDYYLKKYFETNLYFTAKKRTYNKFRLKKKKLTDDTIWVYLELPFKRKPTNITLTNTILLDLFSNQSNLVIFSYHSSEMGYRFTENRQTQEISLN